MDLATSAELVNFELLFVANTCGNHYLELREGFEHRGVIVILANLYIMIQFLQLVNGSL